MSPKKWHMPYFFMEVYWCSFLDLVSANAAKFGSALQL